MSESSLEVSNVTDVNHDDVAAKLDQLERDGFLVISGALSPEEVQQSIEGLNNARRQGWQGAVSEVGSLWFDSLLDKDPQTFRPLVAHASVSPYLEMLAGAQLQLRSFRGHIYPGPYTQQWHMDFYGYWQQPKRRYTVRGTAIQTTFYLHDHSPETGYLRFVKGGHLQEPPSLDRSTFRGSRANDFTRWCEEQEHVTIYPQAGDCILFFSHIPHRGAKDDPRMERSNIVCHYQVNPFFEGLWFVSSSLGFKGTFPLAPSNT
ncbi:MAG: phytanoyl-CoA dioxygenase family protein [Herpetosiphonaceae bacterium]|nr:phytanoyl-CoA dioxygenase family protein [Herpetosiphonaceae bacterium]